MAETLPTPMPMDGVLPEIIDDGQAAGSETSQPEGPNPTETIYIQNLNEKIRVDSMYDLPYSAGTCWSLF